MQWPPRTEVFRNLLIKQFAIYIYTVKLVYSDHWKEFWKRSYKRGYDICSQNFERGNHLVRVYYPHQLLNPFVWRTNAWNGYNEITKCVKIIFKCLWVKFREKQKNNYIKWSPVFYFFSTAIIFLIVIVITIKLNDQKNEIYW